MSQTKQTITIRQNFSEESESLLNDLVNMLFNLGYTCKSMAYYFDRDNIGLFGMADFNRWFSYKCVIKARQVMDVILERGGCVSLEDIKKPTTQEWGKPLDSLRALLKQEQALYDFVLKCHDNVDNINHDPHLNDFLETELVEPIAAFIRKLGVLISNLTLAGTGLGEYHFNKDLEQCLVQIMSVTKLPHFHDREFELSPF